MITRDDKKERAMVHKEWLLNRGFFKSNLGDSFSEIKGFHTQPSAA
jgi:hypothetical protein